MDKKSLWSFENFEDVSEYSLPKHNSKHFIDADFINHLLYIYEEDSQKGIQYLTHDKVQETAIKGDLSKFLESSTKESITDFLRICFDFDNNVILIKMDDGLEKTFYYLDLITLNQKIIECLNLETISGDELSNEFEAMMLLHNFENIEEEEKIALLRSFIKLKYAFEEALEERKKCQEYIELLEEQNKKTILIFRRYLNGQLSKKDIMKFITELSESDN